MSKKLRGNIMLIITAFIWGSAFVAQSVGMDYVGPFTFNGARSFIAAIFLVPVFLIIDKITAKREASAGVLKETDPSKIAESKKQENATLLKGGILCGIFLFAASSLQQVGIQYTTVGKAGFITALYIVLVPILGLFLKKKVRPILWLCVIMGAVGLYFLCMTESFSLSKGDFLVLLCAIVFAGHILVIDHFSPKVNGIKLSCVQFLVTGILSLPLIFTLETFEFSALLASWKPLLYLGILSGGIAYTLQIVAQKDTDPTVASLLLSLESVFAVLSGMVVLHEMMTGREFLGCALMFVAIILAQLPSRKEKEHL